MESFNFLPDSTVSRVVDLTIYSQNALAATQRAFKQHCRVSTEPLSAGRSLLLITPLLSSPEQTRAMILEFWNYFLDQTCQEKLG
jgi:hypothetical protein